MTSFSVAKAYIQSGATFWISKYIQVLGGRDREMSLIPGVGDRGTG